MFQLSTLKHVDLKIGELHISSLKYKYLSIVFAQLSKHIQLFYVICFKSSKCKSKKITNSPSEFFQASQRAANTRGRLSLKCIQYGCFFEPSFFHSQNLHPNDCTHTDQVLIIKITRSKTQRVKLDNSQLHEEFPCSQSEMTLHDYRTYDFILKDTT